MQDSKESEGRESNQESEAVAQMKDGNNCLLEMKKSYKDLYDAVSFLGIWGLILKTTPQIKKQMRLL